MDDNKINMNELIGKCGLIMGAYYIVRFACIPLSLYVPALGMLFIIMLAGAPFFTGYITMVVREKFLGGVMTFKQGVYISSMIMFYGSLIDVLGQYIYFRFIDKGMMIEWLSINIKELEKNDLSTQLLAQLNETIEVMANTQPIVMAMSSFLNGIIWIIVIALFIGLILRRKNPKKIV